MDTMIMKMNMKLVMIAVSLMVAPSVTFATECNSTAPGVNKIITGSGLKIVSYGALVKKIIIGSGVIEVRDSKSTLQQIVFKKTITLCGIKTDLWLKILP